MIENITEKPMQKVAKENEIGRKFDEYYRWNLDSFEKNM